MLVLSTALFLLSKQFYKDNFDSIIQTNPFSTKIKSRNSRKKLML